MASISKRVISMYSLFLVTCLTSVIRGQSGFVQPTGLSTTNTASQFSTASNIIPNSNAFVQSANTFYPGDVHSAKGYTNTMYPAQGAIVNSYASPVHGQYWTGQQYPYHYQQPYPAQYYGGQYGQNYPMQYPAQYYGGQYGQNWGNAYNHPAMYSRYQYNNGHNGFLQTGYNNNGQYPGYDASYWTGAAYHPGHMVPYHGQQYYYQGHHMMYQQPYYHYPGHNPALPYYHHPRDRGFLGGVPAKGLLGALVAGVLVGTAVKRG